MSDLTDGYGAEPRLVNGRYELGAGIGYGGMAEVYRGRDVRMGRDVAIKVLRSDLARDPNFLKRFEREARSAAALEHPAIVRVYDTGEGVINGTTLPYIVMEFVEGRTLREVLQREGPIDERRAMEITSDVCAALDYSHSRGIIHRDVKPANVMLTPAGVVKVMDFGIAKASNSTSSTMTGTQAVIGTAQYLSPEQARGSKVDARSDVYSTGVLFYELITGEPPFRGDNPVAVAYQHVREIPDPPSRHNPKLTAAADAITLKALEKEPDDRYSTAGEMRDDLEAAIAGRRTRAQATGARPLAGPGTMAATQIAGSPRGYRDDYTPGGYTPGGYDTPGPQDRYQEPGYQDTSYQQTARYQGGGPGTGYGDQRARGGYGYDRGPGGYADEFDDFGGPGEQNGSGPGGYGGAGAPPPAKRSNVWKWVLAALAVVLTFVVVSLVATSLLNKGSGSSGSSTSSEITIPVVIGQPRTIAVNRLTGAGLNPANFVYVNKTVTDPSQVDSVLQINPTEGQKVAADAKITMTIGAKPNSVPVPNVVGDSTADAETALSGQGFTFDVQTYTGKSNQASGTVAKTSPSAGTGAALGSKVIIYVVNSISVPDETGRTLQVATSDLQGLGFTVQSQQEPATANQAPGTVIGQNPKAGSSANRGDTVTLSIAAAATSSPSATPTATATNTGPLGGGGLPSGSPSDGSATPSPTP